MFFFKFLTIHIEARLQNLPTLLLWDLTLLPLSYSAVGTISPPPCECCKGLYFQSWGHETGQTIRSNSWQPQCSVSKKFSIFTDGQDMLVARKKAEERRAGWRQVLSPLTHLALVPPRRLKNLTLAEQGGIGMKHKLRAFCFLEIKEILVHFYVYLWFLLSLFQVG